MAKVLIADKLSSAAAGVFNDRGIEAVVKTGLTEDQLVEIIGDFDGVAVRFGHEGHPPRPRVW